MKSLLAFALLFSILPSIQAQYIVKGTVRDAANKQSLPLATIVYNDSLMTETDTEGNFIINSPVAVLKIEVAYVGYETFADTLASPFRDVININIDLKERSSILNTVVVTGNSYDRSITDEPVSIEVLQPAYLKSNNITSLDRAIERVPGIQVFDGQASIRSSGFTVGVGSRVGIIVDGMTMLGGEGNNIPWNFVPLENVDQIEVIKGAASVLYGSAAMNGIINVRTAWPTDQPHATVTTYASISDRPAERYRQWWGEGIEEAPRTLGVFFSYRQKFGKLDVVLGGNAHDDIKHIEGDLERRLRFNVKTRYRFTDSLNLQLSIDGMNHVQMPYITWLDGDTNVLRPQDELIEDQFYNLSIAPTLTYRTKSNYKHTLRGRYYNTTFQRLNGELLPVHIGYGEYQLQKKFGNTFVLATGASAQYFSAQSPNFGVDTTTNDFVSAQASFGALYAQGEGRFWDGRLNVIAGIRWEYIIDAGTEEYPTLPPVLRLAATYKITPRDILRASWGTGYRIPSLAERYVDRDLIDLLVQTSFENPTTGEIETITLIDDGLGFLSNYDLRPEYGWSAELGYKRLIQAGAWSGYLDAALFVTRYWDMIYPVFDYYGDVERPTIPQLLENFGNWIGFRYINLENTMVAGVELGANVSGKIGDVDVQIWTGYTYTYPGDLNIIEEQEANYWENFTKAFTMADTAVKATVLTNRSTHVARFDIQFFWKTLSIGFTANFDGFMHSIDPLIQGTSPWSEVLEETGTDEFLFPGVVEYREANPNNPVIYDIRMGWQLNDHHSFNFVVNNVANTTYSVRAGRIRPLRTFTLKYTLSL